MGETQGPPQSQGLPPAPSRVEPIDPKPRRGGGGTGGSGWVYDEADSITIAAHQHTCSKGVAHPCTPWSPTHSHLGQQRGFVVCEPTYGLLVQQQLDLLDDDGEAGGRHGRNARGQHPPGGGCVAGEEGALVIGGHGTEGGGQQGKKGQNLVSTGNQHV